MVKPEHGHYRPEVDGLRAIAVLSVVAFHALPGAIPSGFVGVDVFFVISGYLITGIIWREVLQDRFSIAHFYERRIRRIMPALLTVLIVTTVVAAGLLLPSDLVGYARSAVATLVFAANLYFWRDTDYFAPAAETKPLLHMWSLGIEEQFYLLFPLLLITLRRFAPQGSFAMLLALSVASYLINCLANAWGFAAHAFYLLPTRAWELGLGACLALMTGNRCLPSSAPLRAASWAALAVLAASLFLSPEIGPTWLPDPTLAVLATVVAITVTGSQRADASALLAWRPVVLVGLVSYSLYLWHWPVLVFARYWLMRPLTTAELLAAFATMGLLSALSFRFVEQPFRKRLHFRRVAFVSGGGGILIAGAAGAMIVWQGMPERLGPEARRFSEAIGTNYRCPLGESGFEAGSRACWLYHSGKNSKLLVLMGDSHAQMYGHAWAKVAADRGWDALLLPANGCAPVRTLGRRATCSAIVEGQIEAIRKLRPAVAVLAFRWPQPDYAMRFHSGRPATQQDFARDLDATIAVVKRSGARVVLTGPVPVPGYELASEAARQLWFGRELDRPLAIERGRFEHENAFALTRFANRTDLIFVRPDRILCRHDHCPFADHNAVLFADSNHFTHNASLRFAPLFEQALEQ
jgi:peptidoglycan/LPS O-acetylase OafA/YrhL